MMKFHAHLTTFAVALTIGSMAEGAVITISSTVSPGANDIYNLTAASVQTGNVSGGDFDSNYVVNDRPAQGQSFTTGSNSGGYILTAITVQDPTFSTFTNVDPGGTASTAFTLRINQISGTTISNLSTENGSFSNPSGISYHPTTAGSGSGKYITFTLATPVSLAANTTYGFDLGRTDSPILYFQLSGTSSDVSANGSAYSSGASGLGNTTLTPRTGDRVFVASLTAVTTLVPEPASLSLLTLGGALLQRRRKS